MNKIIIDEEDRNLIQRFDIEQAARKNLISFLLKENINNEEKLTQFQNEYIQCFNNFEQAKMQVQQKYLDNQNIQYANWHLNYSTCELEYS